MQSALSLWSTELKIVKHLTQRITIATAAEKSLGSPPKPSVIFKQSVASLGCGVGSLGTIAIESRQQQAKGRSEVPPPPDTNPCSRWWKKLLFAPWHDSPKAVECLRAYKVLFV